MHFNCSSFPFPLSPDRYFVVPRDLKVMLEFCFQQNFVPGYQANGWKHPSPPRDSAVLLEQPAPDPGIIFPAKALPKAPEQPLCFSTARSNITHNILR